MAQNAVGIPEGRPVLLAHVLAAQHSAFAAQAQDRLGHPFPPPSICPLPVTKFSMEFSKFSMEFSKFKIGQPLGSEMCLRLGKIRETLSTPPFSRNSNDRFS